VRIWSRSPHSIRWKSRLPCRGVLPRSVLVQFPVMDCQERGICLTQVARVLWSDVADYFSRSPKRRALRDNIGSHSEMLFREAMFQAIR
jgi:hypothetical protein